MSLRFDTAAVPHLVYRVARRPDAWQWTDWSVAGSDGTFGGRWDDPQGRYRVLYAGETPLGAYLEVLAPLRPDLHLLAEYQLIEQNDEDAPLTAPAGSVPVGWRGARLLGVGVSDGVVQPLVAVSGRQSLATLRRELAGFVLACGLDDLDAAAIRMGAPRRFTQGVSRFIYEQTSAEGSPYCGIFYLSRFGDEIANFALFERGENLPVSHHRHDEIGRDDSGFLEACRLLRIRPE